MTDGAQRLHRFLPHIPSPGARDDPSLLGLSWIGPETPADPPAGPPLQHIRADCLAGDAVEAWFGAGPVEDGARHGVRWRHDGELLFGVIDVAEDASCPAGVGPLLQRAGRHAYRSLFRVLAEEGYPHLWRTWNYLADINGEHDGLERYRQFNVGRHEAFEEAGRLAMDSIPAASALGVAGGPLSIAFLAARTPAVPVENPRQLSAYRYPADYGPRSPTFSRAALGRLPGAEWLFVSGTASIVGHRSIHPDDAVAQTREIIVNLEALLAEASRHGAGPAYRLDELGARVYLRRPADLPAVRGVLAAALGEGAPVVYLHADVCRADLLVEIEAQACHLLS